MKVASLNLRNSSANDGPFSWRLRRDRCIDAIRSIDADLWGFQEVLPDQLRDLEKAFPDKFIYGVPRENGVDHGESCAIMVSRHLEVKATGTFWLSESPHRPGSQSWDTACTRIASWASIKDPDGECLFINTHWDHESDWARRESAGVLDRFLRARDPSQWDPREPVCELNESSVLLGDFNCPPDARDLAGIPLADSRQQLGIEPEASYQGFGHGPMDCIDHVFAGKTWRPVSFKTLTSDPDFISDHNPVVVELVPA